MLPDLGKYAEAVIWSYIASIVLLALLIGWSLWRGAQIKRALAEVEARATRRDEGGA